MSPQNPRASKSKAKAAEKKVTSSRGAAKTSRLSLGMQAGPGLLALYREHAAKEKDPASAPIKGKRLDAIVLFVMERKQASLACEHFDVDVPAWQFDVVKAKDQGLYAMSGEQGPVYLVYLQHGKQAIDHHHGQLSKSIFGLARDNMGAVVQALKRQPLRSARFCLYQVAEEAQRGLACGLEIAMYKYLRWRSGERQEAFRIEWQGVDHEAVLADGAALGHGVNVSRHLVNLPANDLTPETYADLLNQMFAPLANTKVEIWDEKRLAKERMGLHLAVGRAARAAPRLVKIRYRPKGKLSLTKPVVIVGKGITFDTGGLDLKPSQYMRLMKKDMGGSAAVAGLAYWIVQEQLPLACDFYFVLAENAVSGDSFRPGDIIEGRAGKTVEIHNTDAEGRLVLADTLSLVSEDPNDAPAFVVDMATLTGAMRVALGTNYAGFFANDDALADALLAAATETADPCWRMPLIYDYKNQLKTGVADLVNASANPFGGAITAALFLEQFVSDCRWLHIDLYAWAEKGQGSLLEAGGNGQMIQAMARFLTRVADEGI